MEFKEALKSLREKTEKRGFDQTLDLILNLKDFDIKRDATSILLTLPNPIKKIKIGAFLESSVKQDSVEFIITRNQIDSIDLKELKKLTKKVDFIIANAKLMPLIASKFGKILGSVGKMPDPKIGCVIMQENTESVKSAIQKLSNLIKVKIKEPSIKLAMGKESMPDDKLVQNIDYTYKMITNSLPQKEMNIKNVTLKFTMSPVIKIRKEKNE